MPTVSEPVWPAKDEKTQRIVKDFLDGIDSADVFKARLHGNGLRGQDMDSTFNVAMHAKVGQQLAHMTSRPTKVLVMERDGTQHTIRFNTDFNAGYAVEILRRQPNVLFASRVYL